MRVYFDTSAINYMSRRIAPHDAVHTKAFQEVRGRLWLLSPVAIFEILNTTDEVRREELIFFSQHLFHEQLLPSPEELLVKFIQDGCPERCRRETLLSQAPMAQVWRNLCKDKRRTFVFDAQQLRTKIHGISQFTRDIHRISRNRSVLLAPHLTHVQTDISLEGLLSTLPWIADSRGLSTKHRTIYKIALYYMLVLICAEAGVDPHPLRRFWKSVGISDSADRVAYLLNNHSMVLRRGPLLLMAVATYEQTNAKFSRGIYWDSLHALYLSYVDAFLTEDQDLLGLRTALQSDEFARKIHAPSEMEWSFHERQDAPPSNPWP